MSTGRLVAGWLAIAASAFGAGVSPVFAAERCAGVPAECLGAPLQSQALQGVAGAGLDQAPPQGGGPVTLAVILWDEAGKPRVQHAGDSARWTQTAHGVRVELSSGR